MNRNNKKVTSYFILFSLMLVLGVVYAILQANLQINGTAKIGSNIWDVHFTNIVVNQNSVAIGTGDSAATIDPNNDCKVDFEVTLSTPGDFYEFTVDVVNAGTIDAMIGELDKTLKVNNVVVETIPEFLIYDVTYDDGVEIEENHILAVNETETYLVHLEFNRDIDTLPEPTTISTSLEPVFIQADSGALQPPHPYDVFTANIRSSGAPVITIGQTIPDSILQHDTAREAMDEFSSHFTSYSNVTICLKHTIKDDLVLKSDVVFEVTNDMVTQYPEMTAGIYVLNGNAGRQTDDSISGTYNYNDLFLENVSTLQTAFGTSHCGYNMFHAYSCYNPIFQSELGIDGRVYVALVSGGSTCEVNANNDSFCSIPD